MHERDDCGVDAATSRGAGTEDDKRTAIGEGQERRGGSMERPQEENYKKTPKMKKPSDEIELAKKLFAAYIAHAFGLKSIDRARKRYVDPGKHIASAWIDLARRALATHQAWAYSLPQRLPVPHPTRPYLAHRATATRK